MVTHTTYFRGTHFQELGGFEGIEVAGEEHRVDLRVDNTAHADKSNEPADNLQQ